MMRSILIYIGARLALDIAAIMLNCYAVFTSIINGNWFSLALSSLGLALAVSVTPSLLRSYNKKAWSSN